jgi:hypothetical protein
MASPSNVRLYPHCKKCSSKQGQVLGLALRDGGASLRRDAVTSGKALMQQQAGRK